VRPISGGVAQPYLIGRLDPLCGTAAGFLDVRVGTEELRQALNLDAATAVGAWLSGVMAVQTDAAAVRPGRPVRRARPDGPGRSSPHDPRAFGRGACGARGSRDAAAGELVFSGRGFGHGAACAAGAQARLLAGERVDGVLAHYFPGASGAWRPDAHTLTAACAVTFRPAAGIMVSGDEARVSAVGCGRNCACPVNVSASGAY